MGNFVDCSENSHYICIVTDVQAVGTIVYQ